MQGVHVSTWLPRGLAFGLFVATFLVQPMAAEEKPPAAPANPEAKIKAALAKLPEQERAVAEAQRFCPMMPHQRLGSMGVPAKVMVAGKAVYLCCQGCEEDALEQPQKTAEAAAKLKKVTAALMKLSPADRAIAEAQMYCPIAKDSRLGSMGAPVKIVIEGKPVFLCCAGCRDAALQHPQKVLATLETLKKKVAGEDQ